MGTTLHGSVVGILIAPAIEEGDVRALGALLHERGARVHYLAVGNPLVATRHGTWKADARVEDVSPGYYDAIVATGTQTAESGELALGLIQDAVAHRRPIGAIGDSVLLLIQSGIARGAVVAARGTISESAEHAGATPVDDVVVDGLLVTAPGYDKAAEFSERLAREIAGRVRDNLEEALLETFPGSDSVSGAYI